MSEMWMLMGAFKWNNLQAATMRLTMKEPGCVAFMPVFDSKQAAERFRDEYRGKWQIAKIEEVSGDGRKEGEGK